MLCARNRLSKWWEVASHNRTTIIQTEVLRLTNITGSTLAWRLIVTETARSSSLIVGRYEPPAHGLLLSFEHFHWMYALRQPALSKRLTARYEFVAGIPSLDRFNPQHDERVLGGIGG